MPLVCYVEGRGMKYVSVAQMARTWAMSERGVRKYCAQGKIEGAFMQGKTWHVPEGAVRPDRKLKRFTQASQLLSVLKEEKQGRQQGGIYHKVQVDLTFNSNHLEGSRLTLEQTRYIYETNTIGPQDIAINVDDIIETTNHFRCIDLMIDRANFTLSEAFIKQLHALLKNGTSDSRKDWFAVGEYKKLPNERYQYPRASPGRRRRCLLFRPKGRFISPCFPSTRSVMEPW